jgi:ABC-type nitrate/sulfonate/bicarbonate transport system permease component
LEISAFGGWGLGNCVGNIYLCGTANGIVSALSRAAAGFSFRPENWHRSRLSCPGDATTRFVRILGFLMFSMPAVDSLLFSFIEFVRPVPPIALIPFFILWFGLNPAAQVGLVGLGCFMVMVISTREALNKVSVDTRRAARSLGASGYSYYVEILLWAIMPSLTGPLRVSLALAFALAVAAEFMGAQSGLGFLMMIARRTLQTETILLGVIILGLESAIMDWLLRTVMKRLTRWHS